MAAENIGKRESNKIDVHRRILKASRRLFALRGYDNTMMHDIAKSANVSKATVYNYFPNKESLLVGTFNGLIQETQDAVLDKADASATERLYTALGTYALGVMKYPDLSRRITYLSNTEGSALFGSLKKVCEGLRELIEEAKENGEFIPGTDTSVVIDMLLGVIFLTLFHWLDTENLSSTQILDRLRAYYDRCIIGLFAVK